MTTEVKFRSGTLTQHNAFTGAAAEMTVETDNNRVHIHDGVRAGGWATPNFKDLQNQAMVYAVASGINTLTATFAPAPSALVAGFRCSIKIANNNTNAVTFNPNGLGATAVKKNGGVDALVADDFVANQIANLEYDGTLFQVQSGGGGGVFSKNFTSTEQTITSAGQLTLAHGLSAMPELVQCRVICKTAEFGYSIGDEAIVKIGTSRISAVDTRGIAVTPDSTNVVIRFGSDGQALTLIHKTTGVGNTINNGNWKLIVRAWA